MSATRSSITGIMYSLLCVAAVTFGFAAGAGSPASGHSTDTYLNLLWSAADLPNVGWKFHTNVPTGAVRNRIIESNDPWDATTANINLVKQSGNGRAFSNDCNDYGQEENVVYWRNISNYGVTAQCYFAESLRMHHFTLSLDSGVKWQTGTNDPNQFEIDLLSIAIHEFGHGGGWSHFFLGDTCSTTGPYSDWNTMCATIDVLDPPGSELGKKFRRTLENHDIHTYENAY